MRSARKCAPLVLTGAGHGFCAGADLAEVTDHIPSGLSTGQRVAFSMDQQWHPAAEALHALPVPWLSAVNGVAAGGGVGLALTADLVVMSRRASFRLVFVPQLGIVPDIGATWHLPRLLGRGRAMALAALGEPLSALGGPGRGVVWKTAEP